MNYDAFKTLAFIQYQIPPQVLEVVRPWVEKHNCLEYETKYADSDLGYAELADIQTVEQGMRQMKEQLDWLKIDGARDYNKFLKDAGGREGKGFYRWALKTYYLLIM